MTRNIPRPHAWDSDRFKRPTQITKGICEHGCCDSCQHGCFDHPYDESFDEFQRGLRNREFCIGWHPIDSQHKTYHEPLYDSWHEAEEIASELRKSDPSVVVFVEAALITKKCQHCNHGIDEDGDACGFCHGKGRIRA